MKPRAEDSLNRFYKSLKVDRATRETIKFFRKWRKEAQKELRRRRQR